MRAGFEVIGRNWRFRSPEFRGELDVIARRDELVVFCEVKARARTSSSFGGGAAAVGTAKQHQVRQLAELWLIEHDLRDCAVRFDVIAVDGTTVAHYPAAF